MKRFLTYLFLLFATVTVSGQNLDDATGISGVTIDAQTGDTLPFVQIYFMKPSSEGLVSSGIGTTSDMDGRFSLISSNPYTTICFQMMGYKTMQVKLRKGQVKSNQIIRLEPDVYGLQDVVVTPKKGKQKYKRKGNPAVELIKNVIAHKDSGNITTAPQYKAQTYSKMSFALENFYPNFKKGFWKNFAFAEKYIDTSGVNPLVTVSIRENNATEYFQRKPKREKTIVDQKRIFGLEDVIKSPALQANIKTIFEDFDIYDDNLPILGNRFVSPLSSTLAVAYYQYYIMDTIVVDGQSCIDLAFVPVNSESYSFTGHLYILNDSTYKLLKYAINIPPNINLNFVSDFRVEQTYKRHESGLWAPERTYTYAKFYIIKGKRSLLARQMKLYKEVDTEADIDKRIFSDMTASDEVDDTTGIRIASRLWDTLRPEPLTFYEASVYDLVEEFKATPKFNSLVMFGNTLLTEFLPTQPSTRWEQSKWDFGPIYSTVSWNSLEGVRLRLGGMTTAKAHPNAFFRTYIAFGCQDLRPKGNATFIYSFDKKKYHPYEPLRNNLSLAVTYDVNEPGQTLVSMDRDHILMSIPTSKPKLKNYQYLLTAQVAYHKEWQNKLSLKVHFNFEHNEAAGMLRYNRVEGYTTDGQVALTKTIPSYMVYRAGFELRYSPGSSTPISRSGRESQFSLAHDAPVIRLTHDIGFLDDRQSGGRGFLINKTEITAEKRFWFSAFGHLDARIQAGMVWNKVPFTELYIPPTSTSIFLAQNAFNLMQPMEFLMDEYVGIFATYYFKGWVINRIPGLNKLKLRGVVSFSGIYGHLTKKNNPYLPSGAGLYAFPDANTYRPEAGYPTFEMQGIEPLYVTGNVSSPIGKLPYMEVTAGIENILKFIRIDYVRRITYNDYLLPDGIHHRHVGAWGRNGVKISFRFAL